MTLVERVTVDIVFKALKSREPFIYCIKGKYKRLGLSVFRECDDKEIALYNCYRKEFSIIKKFAFVPTKKEVNLLVEYFERIAMPDIRDDEMSVSGYRSVLHNFLDELNEVELHDLIVQVMDVNEAMNYSNGTYHCGHDNKGKRICINKRLEDFIRKMEIN